MSEATNSHKEMSNRTKVAAVVLGAVGIASAFGAKQMDPRDPVKATEGHVLVAHRPDQDISYTVKQGDTPTGIANDYAVSDVERSAIVEAIDKQKKNGELLATQAVNIPAVDIQQIPIQQNSTSSTSLAG